MTIVFLVGMLLYHIFYFSWMVLCREYMDWNTFFSDEVTMPHGFGNMLDDSQNDFYHPNQSDEMFAYHDGFGNQHEDPDNGLNINPPPPTWWPWLFQSFHDWWDMLISWQLIVYLCICMLCKWRKILFLGFFKLRWFVMLGSRFGEES